MNRFYPKFFFIYAIAVTALFSSCNKTVYNSHWSSDSVSDSLSFSNLDMKCDISSGIYYKISNTDSLLIFELCILNEITQQKVLTKGLTVWIDTTNKSKKETGFVYPFCKTEPMLPEGEQRPDLFSDAGRPQIPACGDVILMRDEIMKKSVPVISVSGLDAKIQMNKNRVLMYRVAMNYRVLGLKFETMQTQPFSVIIMTKPLLVRQSPQQDDPNGAQNPGNVVTNGQPMPGNTYQSPYYNSGMSGSGYPGTYTGHIPQENAAANKTDKIVIKNIILESGFKR